MKRKINERHKLKIKKVAGNASQFNKMRTWFPDRLNILSEGDSWFAYPPKGLVAGKPANLIDHISRKAKGKSNFYSMASNGDEAVDMVSGKQKHSLVNILRWHTKAKDRKPVDLLLFSGGGNDVVGENDFERFLKPYKKGFTAKQCVNLVRLKRKTKQISLAYEELLDIRDHYSPSTIILTHTYDYPYPSKQGGVFLGGLVKTESWMKPYMDLPKVNIPESLQADVIKIFMDSLADATIKVASKRSGFIVVETRGTLKGKKHWLNEIHPDSKGFELLSNVMYKEIVKQFPSLK